MMQPLTIYLFVAIVVAIVATSSAAPAESNDPPAANKVPYVIRGVVVCDDAVVGAVDVLLVNGNGVVLKSTGIGMLRYFEFRGEAPEAASKFAVRLATSRIPRSTTIHAENSVLEAAVPSAMAEGIELILRSSTLPQNKDGTSQVSWMASIFTVAGVFFALHFRHAAISIIASVMDRASGRGGPRRMVYMQK